jgi:RNA polymerase sigma-70 factor, ECF subfamily
VSGLTTEEIARGFHVPVSAMAQRIVRAKRALRAHGADFREECIDFVDRVPAMLDVIYLTFNEGYLAAGGESLTRGELAFEAYRLACLLTELTPAISDTWALRALLSFQLSRWATRTDAEGAILTLDAQDRSRWNREVIEDGVSALRRARRPTDRSPLVVEAELAACHATAPSFDETDWAAIVRLYDQLATIQDTPVVALNRAVAIAMWHGPAAGLTEIGPLTRDQALRDSHRVWAVRADLYRRLGSREAALADYDKAIELVANNAERQYLLKARARAAANVSNEEG